MDLQLASKTVIVTGGGSNIGRAVTLAFAGERANVVVADIDEAAGQKVAAEAQASGAPALAHRTDVGDWASVQALVRTVEERFGRVDVLVNNVGWTRDALFVEKPREEWEREIRLNLWGMINCTRAVLDGMIARRAGAVVSMGSDAGRIGEFREGVYGACKAGVMALTKSLAREVGKHGIRLNVVCPGMTMPEADDEVGALSMWRAEENRAWMTPDMRARIARAYPLRRVARPQDVTGAVLFLASDAAAGFITGQTLSVSGGYTML
jgi:2-hydroxycyclohexanecarboxyl-CoA dehydrogenase